MTTIDERRETLLTRYCASPYRYERRQTRVVMVGDVAVGGDNPIRVQSMTTTRTLDTEATVAQAIRLVDVGCEIVRITAPTVHDARNLGNIRRALRAKGITVPLVADIHFSPAAALVAAEHVEKVRINPGNFADSKTFTVREYSDEQYHAELARIEVRFKPLVLTCKQRGVAMRIGTNHGSLSDRIMNRFGDTPLGMVESALEFVRICGKYDYHDVIFSMKASNPKVMVEAYRLLAARLAELGLDYPFHLGVTEAGNAEDGRIKSAVGIGTLLADGIGDTIRVSLTEDPEAEIPVAFGLAAPFQGRRSDAPLVHEPAPTWDPFQFTRRPSVESRVGAVGLGDGETIRVVADLGGPLSTLADPVGDATRLCLPLSKRVPVPDLVSVTVDTGADVEALPELRRQTASRGITTPLLARVRPGSGALAELAAHVDGLVLVGEQDEARRLVASVVELTGRGCTVGAEVRLAGRDGIPAATDALVDAARAGAAFVTLHHADSATALQANRWLVTALAEAALSTPLLLRAEAAGDDLEHLLRSSIGLGALLCDGLGDAVTVTGGLPLSDTRLAFNVLQAAGARITKTDYVACPSCGRTLFDLQTTTERIKVRTNHLSGVKIAIMGCVVNGPGEMADADFGYVGGSPGHVNLYVGKECVERGVPEANADDRLIDLIRSRGRWVEPE